MRRFVIGLALSCVIVAPQTLAREGGIVSSSVDAETAAFGAARAHFIKAAAALTGRSAEDLIVYPETPGDHWDRTELAALRTGAYYAWRAHDARDVLMRAFASADGAAHLTAGLWEAIASGKPVARDEPGLARVLSAAGLGTDAATSYLDTKKRLAFLFDRGVFERLCPIEEAGGSVRLRWLMSHQGKGRNTPGGPSPILPMKEVWITVDFAPKAGTARLSTGAEGC